MSTSGERPTGSRILLFLKGAAMGAANVIPGVSGGTIAFISGIYERLINAINAFNVDALKLLAARRFGDFCRHVDLGFLTVLGAGAVVSVLSLARVMKYLFAHYEVHVWAFFFGLILASVLFVGKEVKRWTPGVIASFVVGTAIAVAIALLKPAAENDSLPYLMLCGVVAMASMIIPGLSGSFVLLLMGNYRLIMIDAVSELNLRILIPVGIGAGIGVIVLSRLLSWIFKRFHDGAVGLLSGFVAGSLLVIWPWKKPVHLLTESGDLFLKKGEPVVTGYQWQMPAMNGESAVAFALILAGFFLVWILERAGSKRSPETP